jgi:TP901 family phage tail tape measure protein
VADVEKTVAILFKGEDQLSGKIRSMQGRMDSFASNAQNVTQPLATLSKTILELDAAVNTLAAVGLAIAIKQSGDFGDSFAEISTLIDATAGDIAGFRTNILDYARVSTSSLEDINAAVYTAISAGTDYRNSIDLITQSEKLATASKADLEPTVKLLASTMNAYGASTDEAQKYSDAFFQTVKLGQTTLPELSASLSQVSSIAAAAGIPIETLMAAIATLTAKGMDTPQAMTALKGAITAIISPSAEAQKAAGKLGIEFSATALKSKGFEGVLQDVMKATGGNIDQVSTLFGNVRGLSGVLGLASDDSERFRANLDAMAKSAGSTNTAYEKMADNFKLINQRLVNNMRATIIGIGDKLIDKYGDVAVALAQVFSTLGTGIDAASLEPLWAMFNEFGDDIIKLFNSIRDNLPEALELINIQPLIQSYKDLGGALKDAFEAVFGEIDLSTPEGLASAIDKIIKTIATLNEVTAGIITGMKPFLAAIGAAIDKFGEMDEETADLVGTILGVATGLNTILQHSGAITAFLATLAGASVINAVTGLTNLGAASTIASKGIALLRTGIGLGGILTGFAAVGMGAVALTATLAEELAPAVQEAITYWDDLAASVFGYQSASEKARAEQEKFNAQMKAAAEGVSELNEDLAEMNEQMAARACSIEDINKEIQAWMDLHPELKELNARYTTETDEKSLEKTKEALDQAAKERKVEVDLQTEKIKGQAGIVKTALEWKAKVDIAGVEAATERLKAAFSSVDKTIESTGSTLTSLWDTLAGGDLGFAQTWALEETLEKEEKRRQTSFELQKKLTEAEIELNTAKARALERGDSMITIDGAGLQPHLEAFMWEILKAIQVRANAEGTEFLLGI